MKRFDAIIIGAGVAGSMTAMLLKENGWDVLIIEKSRFPRNKVCGEFLSPAVWPLFNRCGLDKSILKAGGTRINQMSLHWPNHSVLKAPLPVTDKNHAYAYGLSRSTLDLLLLREAEQAGCCVLQGHEARGVRNEDDVFRVQTFEQRKGQMTLFESSLVINAAGRTQRFKPDVLPTDALRQPQIGFKAHFKGKPIGPTIKLFFYKAGYLGLADVEGGTTNLCGLVDDNTLKKCGANFDHLLEIISQELPELEDWLSKVKRESLWFSCGAVQDGLKSGFREGVFYIGDAAGFVEPFLGQGMTMSIATGFVLSSVLGHVVPTRGELNILGNQYEAGLKKLFATRLSVSTLLKYLTPNSRAMQWLRGAIAIAPPVRDALLRKACEFPAIR